MFSPVNFLDRTQLLEQWVCLWTCVGVFVSGLNVLAMLLKPCTYLEFTQMGTGSVWSQRMKRYDPKPFPCFLEMLANSIYCEWTFNPLGCGWLLMHVVQTRVGVCTCVPPYQRLW